MATKLPSSILIIGATGTIGRYITNAILAAKPRIGYQQIAIFTSPTTASSSEKASLLDSWKSQGVSVITGDITNTSDIARAYSTTKSDTVISALGRTGLQLQIELLRVAEESGTAKWFFPSEYGTDIEYDASSKDEQPHQNKLKVRKYIRENTKGLKNTYVVTGPYIDMFLDYKPGAEVAGGYDAKAKKAVLAGDGEGKVGFTSMPDVGKFVAAALAKPEASQDKILKVQSFVVTPKDILQEFEKQTGGKWSVDYTPLDELSRLEQEYLAAGKPIATLFTLRRIWANGGTLYEKTDNESLGVTQEDLEHLGAVVKRAVDGKGY